jgi:hypothetical protein
VQQFIEHPFGVGFFGVGVGVGFSDGFSQHRRDHELPEKRDALHQRHGLFAADELEPA